MAVIVLSALASCSAQAGDASEADCPIEDGELFVLMAQSVPSATLLPCIAALPAGWGLAASHPLRVPGVDAERHLIVVRRSSAD